VTPSKNEKTPVLRNRCFCAKKEKKDFVQNVEKAKTNLK